MTVIVLSRDGKTTVYDDIKSITQSNYDSAIRLEPFVLSEVSIFDVVNITVIP